LFPGGLGAKRFVHYAKGEGLILTLDEAEATRSQWLLAFPEMEFFLKPRAEYLPDENGINKEYYSATTFTGRPRARCTYSSASNTAFQGPAADGGKLAIWELYQRSYRMVNFVHDEVLFEIEEDENLTPRVRFAQTLMENAMRKIVTDVAIRTEAAVMRRWSKSAEEICDDEGRLLVWDDVQATKKE